MKQTISEQALALIEKKLPASKGQLTPQDAATATGVTVDEARSALSRLMELYVTRVTCDDQGNLLFVFEFPLRRRGTRTFAETWAQMRESLWRGFKVFFKVWTGVMVVGYFVVMILVLLALAVAKGAASRDSDDDDMVGSSIGALFRVLAEGLQFAFWSHAYAAPALVTDDYGYRHRRAATPRGAGRKEKSFIIAIYDLVLGPERPPSDTLADEREVAAFLRAESGVLTPIEITALSGCPIDVAEERMADYLVRFEGDARITDEGVVVGEFASFMSGAVSKTDDAVVPYWEEFEAPFEHSGNSGGRNTVIILMVLVTLVVGAGLLGGGLERLAELSPLFATGVAAVLLGYIPVAFSVLYLLISAARLPGVGRREAARLKRNREKKVMRVIFQQRLWRATADQLYFALVSLGEKDLQRPDVPGVMERVLPKLHGEIELGDDGEPVYVFERVRREIEAAERMRG